MKTAIVRSVIYALVGIPLLITVACENDNEGFKGTRISRIVQFNPASNPANPDTLRTIKFEYQANQLKYVYTVYPDVSGIDTVTFSYIGPLLACLSVGTTIDSLTYNIYGQLIEYSAPHMVLTYNDNSLLNTFTYGSLVYTMGYDFNYNVTTLDQNEDACLSSTYTYDDKINPIRQLKIPPRIILNPLLSNFNMVLSQNNTLLISHPDHCEPPTGYYYDYDGQNFPLRRYMVVYAVESTDPYLAVPTDTIKDLEYIY